MRVTKYAVMWDSDYSMGEDERLRLDQSMEVFVSMLAMQYNYVTLVKYPQGLILMDTEDDAIVFRSLKMLYCEHMRD